MLTRVILANIDRRSYRNCSNIASSTKCTVLQEPVTLLHTVLPAQECTSPEGRSTGLIRYGSAADSPVYSEQYSFATSVHARLCPGCSRCERT